MKIKIVILFFFCAVKMMAEGWNIIPKPQELNPNQLQFSARDSLALIGIDDTLVVFWQEILISEIENCWNGKVISQDESFIPKNCSYIRFILSSEEEELKEEGYKLNIYNDSILIIAAHKKGLFYGIQTLTQLLPNTKNDILSINGVFIRDNPRFEWRGTHLDVSRHFYDIEFIKKWIRTMSYYKMNVFHWHLTDDQGWRIQINKFPLLTEKSAWRQEGDTLYGGYYTQEEIQDIVAYAKKYCVNIMPEIEMPGHSQALLAAYPEISCTGGPYEVWTEWGISKEVICAGKEESYTMMKRILDEVIPLFPFEYIHLGGDECPKDRWRSCPDCQDKISQEGLEDEHELQSFFMNQMINYVQSKGKKAAGWDEIMDGGGLNEALIFAWQGLHRAETAVRSGFPVVFTASYYFNMIQSLYGEPSGPGNGLTVKDVYYSEPVPQGLSMEESALIKGAESCLWTEYIEDESHGEYMMFPRLLALSEILWNDPLSKDYDEFMGRVYEHYSILSRKGVYYRFYPQTLFNGDAFGSIFDSCYFINSEDVSGILLGGGYRPGSDGILWQNTQDTDESSVCWDFQQPQDLSIPFWNLSLQFYLKSNESLEPIRFAFYSSNGKRLSSFFDYEEKDKGKWKIVKSDIKDWIADDGFDSTDVKGICFYVENPLTNRQIVLSDLWLGYADTIPPLHSPLIFFNGKEYSDGFSRISFYNSHSSSGIIQENGKRPGSHSILWKQRKDGGKSGLIWQFQNSADFSEMMTNDTLKISVSANEIPKYCSIHLQDSDNLLSSISLSDQLTCDGSWYVLEIPLHEFTPSENFNSKQINYFRIETDSSQKDLELEFTDIWIGSPPEYLITEMKENQNKNKGFLLKPNYPNPCATYTNIEFILPHSGKVTIGLYNLLGEKIKTVTNEVFEQGPHKKKICCSNLPNGIYFYSLKFHGSRITGKMTVLR